MNSYQRGTNVCSLPQGHPALPERIPNRKSWPSVRVFFTTCAVCTTLFATPYTVSTCSKPCARVKRRWARREEEHRRRARERQAYVAPVDRKQIFERDRWRCHLCGKRVRRTAPAPHPLSPSIDHVIPLAVGGTHEPANVRTAHFLCNSLKAHRGGGEQLMLIG
ncbi:HNH endonuclease [Streptomyces sp. NPDC057426]|uniref:HNH endonuclease n=1 Tax=Streptomyces sp. NPDC057426 TaxID=3346128 RepID=UPI00368AA80D